MTRARGGHLVPRPNTPSPYVGQTEQLPCDPRCPGHWRRDPQKKYAFAFQGVLQQELLRSDLNATGISHLARTVRGANATNWKTPDTLGKASHSHLT